MRVGSLLRHLPKTTTMMALSLCLHRIAPGPQRALTQTNCPTMSSPDRPTDSRNMLIQVGGILSGLLMFGLVCITFVDVVGRKLGYPLSFAFELTQVTVGLMFYVTLPLVTLRGEHIVVDFVPFREGSLTDLASHSVVHLLSALIMSVAAVQLWQQGSTLQTYNTVLMFTRWPLAPVVYFMSAMAAVTALILFALAIHYARQTVGTSLGKSRP